MTDSPSSPTGAGRRLTRAAGTVMAAILVTQATGLLLSVVINQTFGIGAELDSFYAANRVTEVLFNLMAGGALGSAFIPTFTGLLAQEKRTTAWKMASAVANLLIVLLSTTSVLAIVFAPQIVQHGLYLLAPGESLGQIELTTRMLRTMLPTVLVFGLSGLVMGILNAHQRFWLPAIAPAMYSAGEILGVWLLPREWGILRLGYGALFGSLLHLLVQLPDLLRLRGCYTPTLGLRMAEVREVMRLMGPRILGVAVVQVNFIVNTVIALSLGKGPASAIALAFTWMLMPQAAIAQAVAIAAMPTFSRQAALGQIEELRSTLASALRGVLLLAVPAAVGLILLRKSLFTWIYQHGTFTAASTELAAWALLWYALGLVGHSLLEVIVRAFYSLHDTRTPVTIGMVAMGLNIVFSFAFSAFFRGLGWMPHGGLALANSLATLLEMLVLLFLLRRRLEGLHGAAVLSAAGQGLVGAMGMGALVWAWLYFGSQFPAWLQVLGGAGLGALAYGVALFALRVPETGLLLAWVRRFSGRLLSSGKLR